jgi:general secretion pathway protein K
MMHCLGISRQRGMAIVLAMLVLALAAIAASGFVFRTAMEWRKFENASTLSQARWVLRAAEKWASAVLRDDARQTSVDHHDELWARDLPAVDSEGYALSGRVEDQDGRFNINNLVRDGVAEPGQLAVFRRLLTALDMDDALAGMIADWLDADDTVFGDNRSEAALYLTQSPVLLPANRPLASLDELIRVRGMDRAQLDRLRPYVTALPEFNGINVNSASAEILAALVDGLTLEQAYTLAAQRDRVYFRTVEDFRRALPSGLEPAANMARTTSRYFMVLARARHDRVNVGSRALLSRDSNGTTALIWRASL